MNTIDMKYQTAALVANLKVSSQNNPVVFVVAGCDEVEATSNLAMTIACNLSDTDNHSLVIGCGRIDEKKANAIGSSAHAGAHAFSRGDISKDNAILNYPEDNVDIIRFDGASNVDGCVIADDLFVRMVKGLSDTYSRIVVAAPFAHETVDASVMAHHADVTVLVAVQEETNRKNLKRASDSLKRSAANLAGICIIEYEE